MYAEEPAGAGDGPAVSDQTAPATEVRTLRFSFVDTQWPDVLRWIADEADLSLDLTDEPPGVFNYIDEKRLSVTEAIDVLNGYLLPRGYALLRRDQFLVVMKIDNPMLPNLVPTVPATQLDDYGDNELLRIVVPVEGFELPKVADQLVGLLGAQGVASPLESSNSLVLQGFGKSLREAVDLLGKSVAPPADDELVFRSFPLVHIAASDAERQIQNLFGLGANPFRQSMQRRAEWMRSAQRGRGDEGGDDRGQQPSPTPLVENYAMNMKVSALRHTNSVLVTATPAAVRLIEGILETIDVPAPGGEAAAFTSNKPQLRVYTVDNADEDDVAETIEAVMPGVVINEDGRNNSIHVLATPAEHRDVDELIQTIDSGGIGNGVEVIPLTQTDPYVMSDLLSSLFENEDRDDRPVITPGFQNRSLIVRGSSAQMAEIRKALASFNEGAGLPGAADAKGRFRRLPLGSSQDAERVARLVKQLLDDDDGFGNRIRVVTPAEDAGDDDGRSPEEPRRVPIENSTHDARRDPVRSLQAISYAGESPPSPQPPDRGLGLVAAGQPAPPETQDGSRPTASGSPAARVTIEVRDGELLYYSADEVALDQVEETIRELMQLMPSRTQWTVFFLKAAPADALALTLVDLLRADTSTDAVIGAGPEYGVAGSQTMRIVPDARTNSLFISGPETQVARAEQFLRLLDTTDLPASLRDRVPRTIPVRYARAGEISAIVQELYKDYMIDPVAAAASGRGDRDRNSQQALEVIAAQSRTPGLRPSGIQLTVAVDEVANALLVSCNDALFTQIHTLVRERDDAARQSQPVVRVMQIDRQNAAQISSALAEVLESTEAAAAPRGDRDSGRR
ncbi:secretin N-terminal domain-containing protein [Pirellulimonas nuda]|uniref:secretin N-terminal domain-containing protein n=1 Tax=Pirellulimonas nuda TaxID=2528009 RepID=UPI0018D44279|nr:secretin N-terminal domain-containing protein [Pirellulimonas nuda]